jgi:hypothetical protein
MINRIPGAKPPAWTDGDPAYRGTQWWTVTLAYRGRQMTTPFGTGPGGSAPEAEDVMSCLLSDTAAWENATGFTDWAHEYGLETGEDWDPDLDPGPDPGKRARDIYARIEAQKDRLAAFLGADYEEILWGTVTWPSDEITWHLDPTGD